VVLLGKQKNPSYVSKVHEMLYLNYDTKYYIETLRKPSGQMIATCYFEAEIIEWVIMDKTRLEGFMKEFSERHKQEIIDMNLEVPKIEIEKIAKIYSMTCPYCYIEFNNHKDLRNHIEEKKRDEKDTTHKGELKSDKP
jgi:hypothetical protein